MDTKQLNDALERLFVEEGQRIVFWNDPDQEFHNTLPFLKLDHVNVLRLDEVGALEAKIRIEQEDSTGKYLLYSPKEEPDFEQDWLLDIRLYSRSFRADRASILFDELGLTQQHLRQHINERRKFFDNKDRLQRLKALVDANDLASDLDRKMIAVLVKADQPEFFNILRSLFHAFTECEGDLDLETPPPMWEHIEKFDLAAPFWIMVQQAFGYTDDIPTLHKLLIRLLVTDYAHHLKTAVPGALVHLVLPPQGQGNAIVCLAQWRDSRSKGASYDQLSELVASLIHLDDHLSGVTLTDLLDVMTFQMVEQRIASHLRELVQTTSETIQPDDIRGVASRRQAGHWASTSVNGSADVPRKALHAVYDALVVAADFFALRNRYRDGFVFPDPGTMFRAYESELFGFDQWYRHFCEYADHGETLGWNLLKPLREMLEACYTNWYVPTLALAWSQLVDPQGKTALLNTWKIDKVPNQYQFFARHAQPRLKEAGNRRVFVIISDAFRYEAAQELTSELNGKYRFEATLTSQLGVLPSYTALGMASLLPHETLSYKANGDVLVDQKPTGSLSLRDEILRTKEGMACKLEELMAKKKEEGRRFIEGKQVIYIYHSRVDDTGDVLKTESDTFQAVRTTIDELANLIGYIINSLNGNYLVVTADHGFLFTETFPTTPDKSQLGDKPQGAVITKKRYVLGHHLPDYPEVAWHGRTSTTAHAEGDMEFLIPKGNNRFHFIGGARFIHGGAMLQEVVVPVITVRQVKGKGVQETKIKPVTVHVLGSHHKITMNRHRFELIQMEPVSDRLKPSKLKVAIYENDEPITNIESVTFESTSEKLDDRKKWVHLVLEDREYDKKTRYRLVLRDAETGIEHQSVDVMIDRAFTDDF